MNKTLITIMEFSANKDVHIDISTIGWGIKITMNMRGVL